MKEPFHPHQHPRLALYNEMAMIGLAIFGAILVIARETVTYSPEQLVVLDRIDIVVALIFLFEFIFKFVLAKNRKTFFKLYWWELLAAIPINSEITRALRVLRIVRALRVVIHLRTARANSKALK